MGCSQSRLDDEEAVQLCKDRKGFIKQAVEQRTRFASGHVAYIESLQRISVALRDYIEGDDDDEPQEFLDSFIKSYTPTSVKYLRPSGNPVVSVEERVQFPEMVQVEAYSPMDQFGIDGFFAMNSSLFPHYSPNTGHNLVPSPPQASQWDFYWNPFSSVDYYGYPTRSNLDQVATDDDDTRGEEEIPYLEEDETESEEFIGNRFLAEEKTNVNRNSSMEGIIEDVDVYDDDQVTDSEEANSSTKFEVSKAQTAGHFRSSHKEMAIGDEDGNEETQDFTVYVNRMPSSMAEVIRDLETQFTVVSNAANDISELLQAKKAQHLFTSIDLSGKFPKPIAKFRSASSCSFSSRVLTNSSSTRNRNKPYDSNNDVPEDPSMLSGNNHQSTLERLYEWEKKLYEEVRSGERFRIAYEKKCSLFKDQDVKGEDPFNVDKTRAAIRDLHTHIKVSMHSVEAISDRIETLRDEELHPQLLQLVKGLAKMWKVMAECHQKQKRILDEAKILLPRKQPSVSSPDPHRPARCSSASILETELKNWRGSFESWIASQRSYVHALTGWLLRCVRSEAEDDDVTHHPIVGLCFEWSKHMDAIHESSVLDGMDYLGSLCVQEVREDCRRNMIGSRKVVEEEEEEEKVSEDGIRVLCGGMSVAISSLADFAMNSSKGYDELVKQWENVECED